MTDVCPNENVTFWLYNKWVNGVEIRNQIRESLTDASRNLTEPYQFNVSDTKSMERAPLIPKAPVKILLHGYGGHKNDGPNPQIRPRKLKKNKAV